MELKEFLYLAALIVFAFACRTFNSRLLQKLSLIAWLAASYWFVYALTESHAGGCLAVIAWFFLPAVQIVGRVRRMRFPLRQEVKSRFPPSREVFPELGELTMEAQEAGYEEVEDVGWEWNGMEHFARLLYHPGHCWQVSITLDMQGGQAYSFVSVTTRLEDGRSFTTTNFPFASLMKFPPGFEVNRSLNVESFEDLEAEHGRFLTRKEIAGAALLEQDTEDMTALLEKELVSQIDHNMQSGLIVAEGEDEFRYSWRGCLYLWGQMVKDMIML